MTVGDLVQLAREALLLGVLVSIPVVAASSLASFVTSMLQSATQISDATLAHLPRLLVVTAVLVAAGRWMGSEVLSFTTRALAFGP
jgi:type III secretion protein S